MMNFKDLKKLYVKEYVRLFEFKNKRVTAEGCCCSPPPLIMTLISLIQVVLYTIDLANGYTGLDRFSPGSIADVLCFDPRRRLQFWRFLTYMFVHDNWYHLVGVIYTQLMVAIPLGMVHGGFKVLGVYLAGVVGGSLASSITHPSIFLFRAGEGIQSLLAAYSVFIIINRNEMRYNLIPFSLLMWTINFVYIVLDKGEIFVPSIYGAFIGLFMGIFILRHNATGKERWVKNIAIVVFILLMGSAIIVNIFYFPLQQCCANSPPGHSSWAFNILCEILPRPPDGQYNFHS